MRSKFSSSSVAKVQGELFNLSSRLDVDDDIYLVLDSPGGSVIAGMHLIDTVKTLPQNVHTITLFAASMGYQTVQNLGKRYIVPSGILMSHRAFIGGLSGQLDGELESRLSFYKEITTSLDQVAAKRVGVPLSDYKNLIINEYWAGSLKAVAQNHADEIVSVKCSKSLMGTYRQRIATFFGAFTLTYSKCPLIRGPIAFVRGSREAFDKFEQQYMLDRRLPFEMR